MSTSDDKKIKLPEYHQSALGMFQKCPKQYEFRYLQGLVVPPKSALTVGKSVDVAETANFSQKITSKTDLKTQDVLDIYSTEFDKSAPGTDWDGDKPGDQKDLGIKMLKVFHEKAAPEINPVTVQETFRIETDAGYALGGTLDITDEKKQIRDIKTSKGEYDPDAVSQSIQATMYDFAYEVKNGEKAAGFIFDVVTKHKEPRYQQVTGQVSETQRERLFESLNIMHSQIQRGEFQYAPEGAWWCSKSWCGYWHLCKGKK
jgi:hypothetical protein